MKKALHTKIRDIWKLPNGDTIIHEDYENYPRGLSNVYCVDTDKKIKWFAELPLENDTFSNKILWDKAYNKNAKEWNDALTPAEQSFVVSTQHGITASYSYQSGKIIESELTK